MKRNQSSDRRIIIIQVGILLWLMAIGAKLVHLQVGEHDDMRRRAERQQMEAIELSPTRGVIYDRNGHELARSIAVKSLYAKPAEINDPNAVADQLSKLLDLDRNTVYERLTSSKVFVAIKRRLTDKEATEVQSLNLAGLQFVNEMKRQYVNDQVASHILGYVNIDEHGQSGIERVYDEAIRGQGGRLMMEVDALKKSYGHSVQKSVPGANVTLTIDVMIQNYAERALAEGVKQLGARGGSVVILRPATGEILAMANYPTFNPNDMSDSDENNRRNRAVETTFEPGSIFKLITYSAALEEKIINPQTKIDCGGGQIRIADRIVRDRPYGTLTATQALAKSSNVAAIKLGLQLGEKRLARYIEQFGFGRRTGVELPAESRGLLAPADDWQKTTMGSIPMGHEIGVTALQAVASYAAIANGGEFVQPYLVSRVVSPNGEIIEQRVPERRRVVSQATAVTLKDMLESVVVTGTGKAAQVSGYRAAGKTGTAQKVDEKTRRYSQTKYVASFAGFAPVSSPEIACIVSIDEPRFGRHHGGDAAAPIFARVVADALHILGVQPEEDPKAMIAGDYQLYDLPSVVIEHNTTAQAAQAQVESFADVAASEEAANHEKVIVPDMTGMSVREAITLCAARGLKLRTNGEGLIASQSPPPGTIAARDAVCQVRLSKQVAKQVAKQEPQQKPQENVVKRDARAAIAKTASPVKPKPAARNQTVTSKKMGGAPSRSSMNPSRNAGAIGN